MTFPFARSSMAYTFIAAAVAVLSACSREPAPQSQREITTVRIGYRPRALVDISPIVIAESKVQGQQVNLQLVAVSSPSEAFARFNAGELDALAGMPTEAVFAQMDDAQKFVAYAAQVDLAGAGWVAIVASPESGAKTLTDLAGKVVASLPTDQANWLLKRALVAAGVPPDDVRVARYTTANPIAGLRSGEHAAIFGPEPANAMALVEGGVVLARGPLSSLLYDGGPVPVAVSIITTTFCNDHPEAYTEFLGMIDDAIALCVDHPDQVREYFAQPSYGGLSTEVRSRLELPVMIRPDQRLIDVTRRFVDDLVRDGLLKQAIDPDRLFQLRGTKE